MKHARKFLMLVMAAFMALVVATPAFAATGTGSVKVTNTKKGQTYTLYKLFDAETGANDAITYTVPEDKTMEENDYFEVNANGFVEAKNGVVANWAKDANAIAWAKSFGDPWPNEDDAAQEALTDGATIEWTGLGYGYYFVDTTLGSFIAVTTVDNDINIADKNRDTTIDKSITGVTHNGDETADTSSIDTATHENAIAQIGDKVSYKIEIIVMPGAENYILSDSMQGLTVDAASLKVDGDLFTASTKVDASKSSVAEGAKSYTITFAKSFLDTVKTDPVTVVVTYDAIVDADAAIGEPGNVNNASLKYGHIPEGQSEPGNHTDDDSTVYVAKITVHKQDQNEAGVQGAEFALKKGDLYYQYDATNSKVFWVENVAQATKFTSDENGDLNGEFKGLANGTYTLEETVVPAGYNQAAVTTIQIKDADYTDANLVVAKDVENRKGTVLPSTGGMGTTILYIVGGILLAGGAIVLISKRRVAEMEK